VFILKIKIASNSSGMLPYRIYLSGGGICAMAHMGALMELSNHVPLTAIKEWMGVSAGSLLAMCICIGFTIEELRDISIRFDFTNIKEVDSIPGWILHFGLDTGERLHKLIDACLHVKGLSSDITFQECYERFGKTLCVVATDLNEASPIVFRPDTTPTYRISDAVRASMSAPYYFQPFLCPKTGHYLVDGAVISNYPLFVLPKEEHSQTLSILIRTSVGKVEELMDLGMDELITRPMYITLREKISMESRSYGEVITIMLGEINILDFSMNEETKLWIIEKGKQAVIEYFGNKTIIKRRYSI
jgi:predicted acylesterase/phospholipase RssA